MKKIITTVVAIGGTLLAVTAIAQTSLSVTPQLAATPPPSTWMDPDVAAAWKNGYRGQGVTITAVDDFRSTSRLTGDLGSGSQTQRHGEWTLQEAGMVAPLANLVSHDFNSGNSVRLAKGLNVLNLSYGMYGKAGWDVGQLQWDAQSASIISYAKNGTAVVSKAAGNDAVAIGSANSAGNADYLNAALKGGRSTIFVGALSSNGTTATPASMAVYSNTAGTDTTVQKQFVVVGVKGNETRLYGTSFAAPIVSGYAAIIGSKFKAASATQITNQLLTTARKDTVANYNVATYGQGEASLMRALAPTAIR